MPKENQRLTGRHEYTAEEIAAQDEKFRTFFTTTVAQVPEEMTRPGQRAGSAAQGTAGPTVPSGKTCCPGHRLL